MCTILLVRSSSVCQQFGQGKLWPPCWAVTNSTVPYTVSVPPNGLKDHKAGQTGRIASILICTLQTASCRLATQEPKVRPLSHYRLYVCRMHGCSCLRWSVLLFTVNTLAPVSSLVTPSKLLPSTTA